MSTIAERIKTVRGPISRDEFANEIGVHLNTVGRYERGESEPDISIASKICVQFGVNPEWLILGTGPMAIGDTEDAYGLFYKGVHELTNYYGRTDSVHQLELLKILVLITARENDVKVSEKQITAVANLYFEEMKARLLGIIKKIKEF